MHDEPSHYTSEQRGEILTLARRIVSSVLAYQPMRPGPLDTYPDYLQAPRGCFVTLHDKIKRLRGCIGTFDTARPLVVALHEMGAAVTRDPRFVLANPVCLAELNDLLVEVSVLTPLQRMERAMDLRLGVDGIYIKARANGRPISGCFLPQVAVDQGWNVEQTLTYCCAHKMGLSGDAWRSDGEMEFHRFQAILIEEAAPGVLKQE